MRIGIVTPRYPPNGSGGGQVSAALLARLLSAEDKIPEVIVYTFDGEGPKNINDVKIKRYDSPSIYSFEILNTFAYFTLRNELVADEIDLIHSYNMRMHPVVGHLSSELDIPSVATLNSYAFIPYQSLDLSVSGLLEYYKRVMNVTTGKILFNRMQLINSFIALSSTVSEIYHEHLLPDQEITVIPNMYDPDLLEKNEKSSETMLDNPKSQNNILYVGSLRETKGVQYLIRAIQYLPDDYNVTIAGGGDNLVALESLANEVGVRESVSLLGHVPYESVMRLYDEAELFVHPGIWPEPFGRTILEAMQFGLPIVATNTGGPAEIIPQEECLCEPENPYSLAKAIERVYSRRTEIGKHNEQYVLENYSPQKVLPQIMEVYKNAGADDTRFIKQ
jgi:glycosyltransferase involved in cell wall biosynthesis